jgi:hypothetical protein
MIGRFLSAPLMILMTATIIPKVIKENKLKKGGQNFEL